MVHGARMQGFRFHLYLGAVVSSGFFLGLSFNAQAHGTYHELVSVASQKIAEQPQRAELYVERGRLHLEHQDWQSTLIDLERADRLAPESHLTEILRAQACALAGLWDAAKSELDRFLNLQPNHPGALLQRARVLNQLGDKEASVRDYRRSLEFTSNAEPDLYQEVSNAFEKIGAAEESVRVLDQALARFGNVPAMILQAVELEMSHGRIDSALKRLLAMQTVALRPEPWMAKRASLLARAGRLDEAQQTWQALADHLALLPGQERSSHAMLLLREQANTALSALRNLSSSPSAPPALQYSP